MLRALFPGFDYIGSAPYDGLRLSIPSEARAVRLSLTSPAAEVFHLQGIQLRDATGSLLDLADKTVGVSLSSCYNDDAQKYGEVAIRSGKGFHTTREHNPWLQIDWRAREIATLEIQNRPDEFGRRSSSLGVAALVRNAWVQFYQHDDPERLATLLGRAIEFASPDEFARALASGDLTGLRNQIIDAMLERARAEPEALLKELDWVLPLVDVYGGGNGHDIQLLGAYFACVLLKGHHVGSLSPARRILSTKASLLDAERAINAFVSGAGHQGGFMFTRHGLNRSQLQTNSEAYLDLAQSVIAVLRSNGIESFLCYGTLLGAVREQGFIPHDDDMDLVYLGNASDPSDLSERERVLNCLVDAGFQISPQWPMLNVHVSRRTSPSISVDLFPSWRDGETLHMYMERMVVRPLPAKLISPLGEVEFYGQTFPAPAEVDSFLSQRYGQTWSESNRFFEWPYPLEA